MPAPAHREPGSGRPRLQLLVSDLKATGVVRNVIAIANAAAADGFHVRLLTCVGDGPLRKDVGPDVTLVDLLGPREAGTPRHLQQRKALLPYWKHTRSWNPHILFSGGNHGHLLSTLAWQGSRGTRILRISNALEQAREDGPRAGWKRRLKFRWLTGQADRLVLVSPSLERDPLLRPLIASGKALVIPNGVDIERVRRGAREPPQHPWLKERHLPLVLAVGRHARQKNFPLLLEAFARARRQVPMRLLFLGEDQGQAVAELRDLARRRGVGSDVTFEPPTANPFSVLAAADVFVLPSLWEGSSNVLLEAIACGTPVVASRMAGNAAEVLDGGRYGLLFDPADADELASAILRQVSPDAVKPGERAQRYSKAATLRRYLQLFRESLPQPV